MLCTVVRWQLSNELDSVSRRGWLARKHLARCKACQRHSERLRHVDGLLTAGAMMAAIPARTPAARHVVRNMLALAAMAATVTALVVVVLRARTPQVTVSQLAPPVVSSETPIPDEVAVGRSGRHDLVHAAASWLDSNPLQDELTALKSDAMRGAAVAFKIAGFRRRH